MLRAVRGITHDDSQVLKMYIHKLKLLIEFKIEISQKCKIFRKYSIYAH
jgi:hypothetical protein